MHLSLEILPDLKGILVKAETVLRNNKKTASENHSVLLKTESDLVSKIGTRRYSTAVNRRIYNISEIKAKMKMEKFFARGVGGLLQPWVYFCI